MKTVQMTIDEELIKAVDLLVGRLHTSRSAFTRQALREALDRHDREYLERQHCRGYQRYPAAPDEFTVTEEDRGWGDTNETW